MTGALDAVELEVIKNQLEGIAEEMGSVLIQGAFSPNIKERADCSTALFDAQCRLVAQAEHIPVHLGAMPDAVEAVAARNPAPGETYVLNDPYAGGTHLPDVTLVAPIDVEGTRLGFGAVRAHHADVGGATPGSLPGGARSIFAEGLRLPPTRIARDGELIEEVWRLLTANMRNPTHRDADLKAQLGAITVARRRMTTFAENRGIERANEAFDALVDYAERRTRTTIADLPDGTYDATDYLEGDGRSDDDIPICVQLVIDGSDLLVDFDGTAKQVEGNVNAPPSVTSSAVYFVTKCVTDPDIPPNQGSFAPITIDIPEGSILAPTPPAAVSGGNVETSQRIADVVFAAFREADPTLPAFGQGTMNNLVIGRRDGSELTYYETIGGGAGATSTHDGLDGVHVGMTNTKNTPIESLERAYPLRVLTYSLRDDSGGDGTFRGGLGIEREIEVCAPMTVSILSERRRRGPPGVEGGEPGSPGRNYIDAERVGSKATVDVEPGTVVRVASPGGGGFGDPSNRDPRLREQDARDGKAPGDD